MAKRRFHLGAICADLITGNRTIVEIVRDEVVTPCVEWWQAAGRWRLIAMLLAPCAWVAWCAFAMRYLEYASVAYPMLDSRWLWLSLVVGFGAVPLIASIRYLTRRTQLAKILLAEELVPERQEKESIEAKKEVYVSPEENKQLEKANEEMVIAEVPTIEEEVTGEIAGTVRSSDQDEGDYSFGETGMERVQGEAKKEATRANASKPPCGEHDESDSTTQTFSAPAEEKQLLGPPKVREKRMSEVDKTMLRLRALGFLHSLLVLAAVWSVSEAYYLMHPGTNFVKIRTYGLWLHTSFNGLWTFALTTAMAGALVVACNMMATKPEGKRRFLRRKSCGPDAAGAGAEASREATGGERQEAMPDAKQVPKENLPGKPEEREAVFWIGCILLNVFTLEILTTLLFYTPAWARPLLNPETDLLFLS